MKRLALAAALLMLPALASAQQLAKTTPEQQLAQCQGAFAAVSKSRNDAQADAQGYAARLNEAVQQNVTLAKENTALKKQLAEKSRPKPAPSGK